jgi:hypothetical protein
MHTRTGIVVALGLCAVVTLGRCAAATGAEFAPLAAGSSSREARDRVIASVPLDRMGPAQREVVEKSFRSTTLYRHLPRETVACNAEFLDFLLARPESLVDVWRVLGISRLTLDPVGPGQWRMADGYGTTGTVSLLYRERHAGGGLLVFHGRGGYAGPLAPKPLTGSCLLIIRHASAGADAGGRDRQAVQVDAFLDVDGLGLELVTRTLQPLIVHSAAANFHEICLFVTQFTTAASRNPQGVARLTRRMSRTDPADRARMAALACGGTALPDEAGPEADMLQTELAARWLPAEQLDGVRPR